MLGFDALAVLPLDALPDSGLAPVTLAVDALLVGVDLPAATIQGRLSAPLEIAVELPAAALLLPPLPILTRPFTLMAQIDFTSPAPLTLYLSDQDVAAAITGQEWVPYIAAYGPLEEITSAGAPATSELVLFNTKPIAGKPRLSDLMRTPLNAGAGTYEFAGAKVTLYRLDEGVPTLKLLNVLYIEEPTEIDARLFRLRMSDQALLLEDRLAMTVIDRTAFPVAAGPAVGRTIARAFGVMRNAPLIPVVDGQVGRLAGAIDATQSTVPLVDASLFPAFGTVQIDVEQITYTAKSGNTLTGCTRSRNGTTAAAHNDQAQVLELRSVYRFVQAESVSGFPNKSITNVRVNGYPPRTAPTAAANAADVVSGKTMAAVTFTVADARAFHTIPVARALLGPAALPGLDETFDSVGNNTWFRTLTVTIPTQAAEFAINGPVRRRVTIVYTVVSGTFGVGDASVNPTDTYIARVDPVTGGQVILARGSKDGANNLVMPATLTFEYETAQAVGSETFQLNLHGDGNAYRINWVITGYTITGTVSAGGGGESTAGVVIGNVTADIEGIQDSAAGLISGTANLLLENPVDIARFILTQLYGVTDVGARWAASRATLATAAYKWAMLLGFTGAELLSDLRRLIALQARAELFIEAGQWDLVVIPDAPVLTQTLDYARDVWDQRAAQAARSSRQQMFTAVQGQAQRDYRTSGYNYVARAQTPGVTNPTQQSVDFPWVQDIPTADALVAFYLGQWQRQRWEIDLVAWENVLPLRKADHITLANHPVLTAHGGTALLFRIIERSYLSGDPNPARIRLRCREGNA